MKSKIYLPDLYTDKNGKFVNVNKFSLSDEEKWDFMDGFRLRGRSGKTILFRKDITPQIAQLLGFIITDGSLISTEPRISLGQNDGGFLLKYLNLINEEWDTDFKFNFDGKETRILSSPLRYILNKYYNIPLGKKVTTVEVPLQIINSNNKDILRHFIAGLFDGDGYLQYYYLKDKPILDHAHFCISTSSHKLIKQTGDILRRLEIDCSISKRNDGRSTLQTAGFSNTLKFYEQVIPLVFHKKRKDISNRIILSQDFIGKFLVELNPKIKNLFREIRMNKLDKNLLNLNNGYNYIRSLRSIESWTYPSKRGKIRSLYVFKACRLLNKNPKDYIPIKQLIIIKAILRCK